MASSKSLSFSAENLSSFDIKTSIPIALTPAFLRLLTTFAKYERGHGQELYGSGIWS